MSLLAEVLQSAEEVTVQEINKKVPELKKSVDRLKKDVVMHFESVYMTFKNKSQMNELLLSKALQSQELLRSLKDKAEFLSNKELIKMSKEVTNNLDDLLQIEFALKLVTNIQSIVSMFDDFNHYYMTKEFLHCVKVLGELEGRIKNIPPDERLDIIDELYRILTEKQMSLEIDLKRLLEDNFEVKKIPEKKTNILKIKKPNEEIKVALLALYSISECAFPLNSLAKYLWELILLPIVNHEVTLAESEDSSFFTLSVNLESDKSKSNYKTVFKNLKLVLQFLSAHFTYNLNENLTTLEYIGNDIRDNLSELIIKNCLRDTIPSNSEELANYKVVIDDTKELEKVLLDTHIFKEDTTSILDYASNVDVLFINKKCDAYLTQGIAIMKRDLHDMLEVGVPYDPNFPIGQHQEDFPQSSISKNVIELLNLCESILQESLRASPECSGRLFTTVAKILLTYSTFVPDHHAQFLATLPQQVALFYNNCQYISHVLLKWNVTYCAPLKPVLVSCDFNNEVTKIPLVGLDLFSNYVEGQSKQINDIMSGAQLEGPTLEKLDPKTEKCIRQCLRQQELLKTVWHKVLPYNNYNKNIGMIVDTLCRSIISPVVIFEDISAKVAEDLVDVIKIIQTRAPKLFINPKEITLFVPSWYKLNELSFVLNSSLVEINDRWADGKGPLALQFEGSELKQLIKALFQNTDRRAAVLAKIYEFSGKK